MVLIAFPQNPTTAAVVPIFSMLRACENSSPPAGRTSSSPLPGRLVLTSRQLLRIARGKCTCAWVSGDKIRHSSAYPTRAVSAKAFSLCWALDTATTLNGCPGMYMYCCSDLELKGVRARELRAVLRGLLENTQHIGFSAVARAWATIHGLRLAAADVS